jgi:hypothetical protein
MVIKIPSTKVKETYKYEKKYFVRKIHWNFSQVSSDLLLGVSAGNCQRFLVDGSGLIRNQMGTRKLVSGRSAGDTLCDTTR